IHRCTTTHEECNRHEAESWYPTRLLELASGGRSMRLILTENEKLKGAYVTLSHRWGLHHYRMLTSRTIDEFKKSINVDSLPTAFQEAGLLAARLGIRYIWIDSLCIKQDADLIDWKREAPRMCDVYTYSFLNLAATSSPDDGTSSLFNTQTDQPFSPMQTDAHAKQYFLIDGDTWDYEIEEAPLQSRAWVFQERLLAPRLLHFGSTQLGWECKEDIALELFPNTLPPGMVATTTSETLTKALASRSSDSSHESFRDAWSDLVNRYSKCDLTKREDKLVAFSGVAKLIEDARQDEYLAGLWKSTLVTDLAWTCYGQLWAPWVDTKFRAPSWSWLSLDQEIHFPEAGV
ncbi:heterokaryon incompatibility protein-domain-containing protein, partial [Mariannaea sp. PMI_226]